MFAVSVRAKLIITLLAALAARHLHGEQKPVVYPVKDEVRAGMILVNFSPGRERQTVEAASSLFKGKCTQAFTDAGLRSPYESVLISGVVFRPAEDLYIYSAKALGLRDERTRKVYAWAFSSGRAQAGTVSPLRRGVALTTDGRARVFLHETAFYGESFWLGTFSLREVLIHEFIHVGGQPSSPGWLGPLRHDLVGFAHYNQIMQACK
jgi:hypothetical protein